MRKENSYRQDGNARKRSYGPLAMLLALLLVVGSAVGGTVAWLIADTDPVVNTFTYGDIDLVLDETKTDEKGNPVDENDDGEPDKTTEGNDYEMIPGEEYLKDPAVTVLAGNEACWLFVKLEEKGGVTNADGSISYDFDDYLTYAVADGWTRLVDDNDAAVEGIWFRYVGEDTDNIKASFEVLEGNKITVKGEVTKEMLNLLDDNGLDSNGDGKVDKQDNYPSLSITAYAVQYTGFETVDADNNIIEQDNASPAQREAAAWKAWKAVEAQNTPANP